MADAGDAVPGMTSALKDVDISDTSGEAQQPGNILIITNVPDDVYVQEQSRVCVHVSVILDFSKIFCLIM